MEDGAAVTDSAISKHASVISVTTIRIPPTSGSPSASADSKAEGGATTAPGAPGVARLTELPGGTEGCAILLVGTCSTGSFLFPAVWWCGGDGGGGGGGHGGGGHCAARRNE